MKILISKHVYFFYAPSLFESLNVNVQKDFGFKFSSLFLEIAEIQLRNFFELITGLKINKHISMSYFTSTVFVNEETGVSAIAANIYINHNWNPITVAWQSRSGKIYKTDDEEIDEKDIVFFLDRLDAALYYKQLYPKATLPFNLKNLSYELVVERLNIDFTLLLTLKENADFNIASFTEVFSSMIEKLNIASEKKDYKNGVVHNITKIEQQGDSVEICIDMGSASFYILKKILTFLSSTLYFEKVVLC